MLAGMVQAIPIHPEAARYGASVLYIPGLWAGTGVWRSMASLLAHRGWEGQLLELCGLKGGLAARAAAVAVHAAGLPAPPVLIGHDAGALVALGAAARGPAAAVVMLAPLVPGNRTLGVLTRRWEAVAALVRGRPIPPPRGARAVRAFGVTPAAVEASLVAEHPAVVLDVIRGRVAAPARTGHPTLVVGGELDPLLPGPAGAAFAATIGAQWREIAEAGHWLLAGPGWQEAVGVVHRWLVQRLGEQLLDLYPEAMAEREGGGDGGS